MTVNRIYDIIIKNMEKKRRICSHLKNSILPVSSFLFHTSATPPTLAVPSTATVMEAPNITAV